MNDLDRERLEVRRLEERCQRDAQLIPVIEERNHGGGKELLAIRLLSHTLGKPA